MDAPGDMSLSLARSATSLAWLCLLVTPVAAQSPSPWSVLARPRTRAAEPTTRAITPGDLMSRLYVFADDSMAGRELDTRGNVMGVEYIAREAARVGLLPAGDGGSFFQNVPLSYRTFDTTATMSFDGQVLTPWVEYIPRDQGSGARSIDGVPSVYGGTWGIPASLIDARAAVGKLVVLTVVPAGYSQGIPGTATRTEVAARFRGAAGVAVAGLDVMPRQIIPFYQNTGASFHPTDPAPSFLYISKRLGRALFGASLDSLRPGASGRALSGSPRFLDRPLEFPARNVVGIIPGSDPALRGEYVAIGAHNDHIGIEREALPHDSVYVVNHLYRPQGADSRAFPLTAAQSDTVNRILAQIRQETGGRSARPDSINNGADDDGSGSVSLLEIAEWFVGAPVRPKRSLLFIWHVGEEEGLFGSSYFTDHPTIPRDSIVTELNVDMIGRGGAQDVTGETKAGALIRGDSNYVQLVGSRRLSTELGNLAESVNAASAQPLTFDYAMDANGHPQEIYCRSDHYEYARYGIPIVFFTTGGHADYHQVTDEPQYIDYGRMAQVSRFVADLAAAVGNLDHRVLVDQPKPDPEGECRQ
jgi:hypothetical protein